MGEQILNQDNIQGYYAKFTSPNYHLCQYRMKQGSHKKYEMYNMHYGTVEDVDMSKSDHGFIGIKVMYDRKFFTADQQSAMTVFLKKYETVHKMQEQKKKFATLQALKAKNEEEAEQKQKLEEMKREQILNQDNIQGYYAKFTSPNYHLCQYRMKQGSHKKYEMYNMHY